MWICGFGLYRDLKYETKLSIGKDGEFKLLNAVCKWGSLEWCKYGWVSIGDYYYYFIFFAREEINFFFCEAILKDFLLMSGVGEFVITTNVEFM